MRVPAFVLLFLIIALPSAPSRSDVCTFDSGSQLPFYRDPDSDFGVDYSFKAVKPGTKLEFPGNRYVMVRVPFRDLITGDLYAVSFPASVVGRGENERTFYHLSVFQTNSGDRPCSDMAVVDDVVPEHRIPVAASGSVMSYGYNDELQARTAFSVQALLHFRTASTHIYVSIDVSTERYADCYAGNPIYPRGDAVSAEVCAPVVEPGDFDLVDDADLSRLTDSSGELLNALDALVDYVSVEKLE